MVGFHDLVGTGIAPVSTKTAVKRAINDATRPGHLWTLMHMIQQIRRKRRSKAIILVLGVSAALNKSVKGCHNFPT